MSNEIGIPEGGCQVSGMPTLFAELLVPAKWPAAMDPYPEGQQQVRQLRDRVGAEKRLWGSDSPDGQTAWCTYRQAIDCIRLHCDFLTPDEKDLILGGNAARMFGIEPYHAE